MSRNLPPLNGMRAFEAAARHLSFTDAAAELSVTPAAVSHQVKALEAFLGVPLFVRLTRALRLTEAGEAALPVLTEALDKLEDAADILRAHTSDPVLRVSVSPAFGALWLVPRLDRFQRAHPDIEIRIDGTDRTVDIAGGEMDVAVRYGPGGYKGVATSFLFNQRNTPVCSPALLNGPAPLKRPADLAHHTLLHIAWKDAEASWRMWLLAAGLSDIAPTRGPHFSQENMAVQAALDGQGVALVGDRLVADHLAAGTLVSPFGANLKTPLTFSYYLLHRPEDEETPKVSAFRDWIREEAKNSA